jgi:CRISPR/Cas system CMR-associated protein Cmr5 small subunit
MKTLAQVRATNALASANQPGMGLGQQGGNALSGFPMLIRSDGILPALAFAVERKTNGDRKQQGCFLIADAIAKHLSSERLALTQADDPDTLVDELAKAADASQLRRATTEALAFLSYLKRFVA